MLPSASVEVEVSIGLVAVVYTAAVPPGGVYDFPPETVGADAFPGARLYVYVSFGGDVVSEERNLFHPYTSDSEAITRTTPIPAPALFVPSAHA